MSANATVQTRLEEMQTPFLQFRGYKEMQNFRYTILVYHYLLGQFRIQLTDTEVRDPYAPEGHGSIVQEMCTYRYGTLANAVTQLRHSKDPLTLAGSWATPANCDSPGGRIRLDVVPRCRVCGCTDLDCRECIERTGEPCSWANKEQTLCTACAPLAEVPTN
jgi:hypothetical protein